MYIEFSPWIKPIDLFWFFRKEDQLKHFALLIVFPKYLAQKPQVHITPVIFAADKWFP